MGRKRVEPTQILDENRPEELSMLVRRFPSGRVEMWLESEDGEACVKLRPTEAARLKEVLG